MSQGFPLDRRLLKIPQSLKRDKRVLDISETTIHVADVVFSHICKSLSHQIPRAARSDFFGRYKVAVDHTYRPMGVALFVCANKVRQDPKYYNICEKFLEALPVDLPLEETTQKLTAMLEQYFCPGGLKDSNVHTDRVLMIISITTNLIAEALHHRLVDRAWTIYKDSLFGILSVNQGLKDVSEDYRYKTDPIIRKLLTSCVDTYDSLKLKRRVCDIIADLDLITAATPPLLYPLPVPDFYKIQQVFPQFFNCAEGDGDKETTTPKLEVPLSTSNLADFFIMSRVAAKAESNLSCLNYVETRCSTTYYCGTPIGKALIDYGDAIARTDNYVKLLMKVIEQIGHSGKSHNTLDKLVRSHILLPGTQLVFDRVITMLLLVSDLIIMELYRCGKAMASYEAQCKDFLFVLVDDTILVKGWEDLAKNSKFWVDRTDFDIMENLAFIDLPPSTKAFRTANQQTLPLRSRPRDIATI